MVNLPICSSREQIPIVQKAKEQFEISHEYCFHGYLIRNVLCIIRPRAEKKRDTFIFSIFALIQLEGLYKWCNILLSSNTQ